MLELLHANLSDSLYEYLQLLCTGSVLCCISNHRGVDAPGLNSDWFVWSWRFETARGMSNIHAQFVSGDSKAQQSPDNCENVGKMS